MRFGVVLHLREGSEVLGVEVVERLVNLALLHLRESLASIQQLLLGSLQLDTAHTRLDLPQASACRHKGKARRLKPPRQPDLAQSLHWGPSGTQWLRGTLSAALLLVCLQTQI